jgi:5-methylcytosine-specific restriction endonuclease McrA
MTSVASMLNQESRRSLCNRFDGRCAYCNANIGMKGTVDHYIPQALGGTNAKSNLRWCCLTCNGLKSDMHPDRMGKARPGAEDAAGQGAASA